MYKKRGEKMGERREITSKYFKTGLLLVAQLFSHLGYFAAGCVSKFALEAFLSSLSHVHSMPVPVHLLIIYCQEQSRVRRTH